MENLPKTVRDRLAAPPPSDHPDADLLTAFSESSLAPRERAEVMRHLSVCSLCREVTSLALPEKEQAFAVAVGMAASPAAPARAREPRSLNLRWGALAACAVIVTAATWIVRHPSHKDTSVLPTGVMSSAKTDSNRPGEIQIARAAKEVSPLSDKKQATAPEQKASTRANNTVARLPGSPALSPTKEVASTESARIASGAQAVVAPLPKSELDSVLAKAQSPAARAVERQAAAPIVSDNARTAQVLSETSEPAPARQKGAASREARDKKDVAAVGISVGDQAGAALDSTVLSSFMRWTLSDGKLRRSTDAGVNWEVVPIDQNSVFRALSVLGEELWVGGKKGVLYHSPDNGKHWVHVVPTTGAELLTEDIVRLEFADADHGKLITPHSEWVTENCGASWHRQQR